MRLNFSAGPDCDNCSLTNTLSRYLVVGMFVMRCRSSQAATWTQIVGRHVSRHRSRFGEVTSGRFASEATSAAGGLKDGQCASGIRSQTQQARFPLSRKCRLLTSRELAPLPAPVPAPAPTSRITLA
ncbi:hypothetical protein PoB_007132200 [Plakobranchus ocellatus]|uniref:Uncharacterized protein n=1 Tax=Plakobranchus ocellatus TaxID=259542 RepID=A0AAV4DKL5_9GAST|nr:hypothetical protein PoB_007132200 [Plakobranchus ocellatus]